MLSRQMWHRPLPIICLCLLVATVHAGNPPAHGDLRDSIDLQLHTVKQTLIEYHPGVAYLEVTNNSTDTLELKLTSRSPDFLTIHSSDTSAVLPPKNSFVFTEELKVASRTYPGTSLVLYELAASCRKDGKKVNTSKVITQEIEMGVLGESGIMTVLGLNIFSVPFFLLLPGFLFVVIWASYLPKAWKTQKTLLAPDKKDPFFWVATITLSMLFSLLYALLTKHFLWISYGLLDVFALWMASVIGAITALFIVYLVQWIRARKEAFKNFTLHDSPMRVLARLERRGADLFLEKGESPDSPGLLFCLGPNGPQDAAQAEAQARSQAESQAGSQAGSQPATPPVPWYCAGIRVKKGETVTRGSREEVLFKDLVLLLRNLEMSRGAGALANLIGLLEDARRAGAITVEFDRKPGLISPLEGAFTVMDKGRSVVLT